MPLPLPKPGTDFQRIVFKRNPLREVICQVRFDDILRIQSEVPVDFQERVGTAFPIYEEQQTLELRLDEPLPKSPSASRSHLFKSEDLQTNCALSRGSISLSTLSYTQWEDFSKGISLAVDALLATYGKSMKRVTRIGLRYRNIIDRDEINMKKRLWRKLINKSLLGPLSLSSVNEVEVPQLHQVFRFDYQDVSALIQAGLINETKREKSAFFIDVDLFLESPISTNARSIMEVVERLHSYSGPLFHWATTEELRRALGSVEASDA
ncbi:MAG: TIGR04255 family protein [Fimbriimonadaceae bacterium]|nr:TIGR04255 family protein [Fimbriimonadaceae bacterium]